MSLHATEIGGTQMAPELAFDLVSRGDEETKRILDNVIFLLVPSLNPDGAVMVRDWYAKTLGTEYEGSDLPWLYHKYAGHDNNRDAFQTNLVESQYMAKILFRDWIPQAFVDHHHMGSYGPRIYVPPYAEPIRRTAAGAVAAHMVVVDVGLGDPVAKRSWPHIGIRPGWSGTRPGCCRGRRICDKAREGSLPLILRSQSLLALADHHRPVGVEGRDQKKNDVVQDGLSFPHRRLKQGRQGRSGAICVPPISVA